MSNQNNKRSIMIGGKKTSVSLEDDFFTELKNIAARNSVSVAALVEDAKASQPGENLSSQVRLFVLRNALARVAGDVAPISEARQAAEISAPIA